MTTYPHVEGRAVAPLKSKRFEELQLGGPRYTTSQVNSAHLANEGDMISHQCRLACAIACSEAIGFMRTVTTCETGSALRCCAPSLPSSEGDDVRRICCTWMLDDEDLGARERIYRGVIPVISLPHWKNTLVMRIAKARHACHSQAHQHSSGAIPVWSTKRTIVDILGITSKVRPRTPQRGSFRSSGQGLEACNGIVHNGFNCASAVENPAGVNTRLEMHVLIVERVLQ